jgi:serine/threonine protein kinase
MLTDFGLSKWVHEGGLSPDGLAVSATSLVNSGLRGAGATPWMAPELLDDEIERPKVTKETDVYALGMLIIEVGIDLLYQ